MNLYVTSALNVLFLLSDLCYIVKPLYNNAEVPIAMTAKLLNTLLEQPVENVNSAVAFCFKLLMAYLYQQDSDDLDGIQLGHNILLQSMAAPDLTLFTVWKNLLRVRITPDLIMEQPLMRDVSTFEPQVTPNASLLSNGLHVYEQFLGLPSERMVLFHDLFLLEKKENTPFSVLTSGKNFKSLTAFDPSWQPDFTGSNSVAQDTVIDKRRQTLICLLAERVNAEKQLHQSLFKLYELYGLNPNAVYGENEMFVPKKVPRFSPLPLYIGPTTSDEETYNNCFLNSALVSLLMFPSSYVLTQLYKTAIQKVHVLDTTSKMCYPKNAGSWQDYRNYITRDLAKKDEKVPFTMVQQVTNMVNNDYKLKEKAADAFRTCLQTFQSNVDPNRIRRMLRELLTTCQSLVSGKMAENQFGEPEVVFEFFQEMFNPPSNFLEKQVVYESPVAPPCSSVQRDFVFLRSLVLPLPVPRPENQLQSDTLLTYFRAQVNQVLESEEAGLECNHMRMYNKRTQTLKYISGTFFCFTVSRTNFLGLENEGEAAQKAGEEEEHDLMLDDTKFVIPDPEFPLSDSAPLKLRAVIVTQGGYHFVCYVLNTFTGQWLYFNGGQLREVGDYSALLAHNNAEVVWRGTSYIYG